MKPTIFTVPANLVASTWHNWRGYIERSAEHDIENAITLDAVLHDLMQGTKHLLAIQIDGQPVGACVVEKSVIQHGRTLFVSACGGNDADAWLPGLIDYLEFVSRKLHCDGVMFCGRLGWIKKLKNNGFKPILVTMWRENQ